MRSATQLMMMGMCALVLAVAQAGCQQGGTAGVAASPGGRAQMDRALDACTAAINTSPNNADAYFNRGFIYSFKGRNDEAIDDYTRAIELRPDHISAYENRGTAYYRKGLFNLALKDYNKAIELKPDYAVAYSNRALTHFALRDYDKAWADVRACKANGGTPDPGMVARLTRASGRSE
jgi:tetratricopeptide (TPR) repeat protein